MVTSASYYLRVDVDDTANDGPADKSQSIDTPATEQAFTFVDLHTRLRTRYAPGAPQIERLTNTVQDHLHLCSRTGLVVFRWPWIAGPEDEPHVDQIDSWIERLTGYDDRKPVLSPAIRVGVIQHRVTLPPILRWGRWTPADAELVRLLSRTRAIEMEALLRRANAIWEPKKYHYKLPSGEHTDVFIRVADAIQGPQDAYVLSCWLAERLVAGAGLVVDTGSLAALLIQLESFLARYDMEIGPTAILDAYPSGRPVVRRTVENAVSETSGRIIGILSVNSSGNLKHTLEDELERLAYSSGIEYTIDVLVNRRISGHEKIDGVSIADSVSIASSSDSDAIVSWLYIDRPSQSGSSSICELCMDAKKSQVVAIDPRTYATMTLPSPHLVMPDTSYADAGHLFWERASERRGTAIEVNPHHTRAC